MPCVEMVSRNARITVKYCWMGGNTTPTVHQSLPWIYSEISIDSAWTQISSMWYLWMQPLFIFPVTLNFLAGCIINVLFFWFRFITYFTATQSILINRYKCTYMLFLWFLINFYFDPGHFKNIQSLNPEIYISCFIHKLVNEGTWF